MSDQISIPQGDGERHPFFHSLPFTYRVSYVASRGMMTTEYYSPHEVILNLKCYQPNDLITYVNRDSGKDMFTITIDKFNLMLAESIINASANEIEVLYGRLLLTNIYSKAIADRGKLKFYDQILRRYISSLKGGIDSYLSLEKRRVILYIKIRRPSIHFITTLLRNRQAEDDIHFYHISLPSILPSQGLLTELIRMDIPKSKFRIYTYDPHPEEDNIIPTDISRELIQVINQLVN